MTRRHLAVFAEVCREGSITRAAETLGMAQPAVSVVIRELEHHYGTRLFERMNRRLYITQSGRRLLDYAAVILAQFDEAEATIRDADVLGALRIGANVTIGATLLPEAIHRFSLARPRIRVSAAVDNTSQIEQRLLKNELDLALLDNMTSSAYLTCHPFQTEEMAVVCSPDYRRGALRELSLEELTGEQQIGRAHV